MSGQNILPYLQKNQAFKDMRFLMQRLLDKGHEVYWAGGCVRDALLDRNTHDFDFATNALPDVVEKLFPETLDHGKKYGTITVLLNGKTYEITTYRSDNMSENHRHPSGVKFSKTYIEDSSRRDFTINALYADIEGNIFDPQNGLQDLNHKIIRSVGEPTARFNEDALRMYRALRFSCQLNFEIEKQTFAAIKKMWNLTQRLSKERRYVEFKKTILALYAEKHIDPIFKHHLHPKLSASESNFVPDLLKTRLKQQIWSNEMKFKVFLLDWLLLVSKDGVGAQKNLQTLRTELSFTRDENKWLESTLKYFYLYKTMSPESFFAEASKYFKFSEFNHYFIDEKKLEPIFAADWLEALQKIIARYGSWPNPVVKAKDLLHVGIKPGPQLGLGLQMSLRRQIEDPKAVKKDILNWLVEELNKEKKS